MTEDAPIRGPQCLSAGLPNRRDLGKLRAAFLDDSKDPNAWLQTQTSVIAPASRPRSRAPERARRYG
jgi:hypothetical protein